MNKVEYAIYFFLPSCLDAIRVATQPTGEAKGQVTTLGQQLPSELDTSLS